MFWLRREKRLFRSLYHHHHRIIMKTESGEITGRREVSDRGILTTSNTKIGYDFRAFSLSSVFYPVTVVHLELRHTCLYDILLRGKHFHFCNAVLFCTIASTNGLYTDAFYVMHMPKFQFWIWFLFSMWQIWYLWWASYVEWVMETVVFPFLSSPPRIHFPSSVINRQL